MELLEILGIVVATVVIILVLVFYINYSSIKQKILKKRKERKRIKEGEKMLNRPLLQPTLEPVNEKDMLDYEPREHEIAEIPSSDLGFWE